MHMKNKIMLIGALTLLLTVVLFMAWDMFFNKPAEKANPYAYDLKSFKAGDTALNLYTEVEHFSPKMTVLHGIAVDQTDRIYLCGDDDVEIFDHTGKPEGGFAIHGMAGCIQVDPSGRIYLGIRDHVEIFDHSGRQLDTWKSIGDESVITSIAISGKDVFVADAGSKVVLRVDPSGNILKKIGEKDPSRNIPGFIVPSPYFDLAASRNGELWVVNPGRHRFEKYNPEGDLLSTWGVSSMAMEGFCGCCNPTDFAMLSDGSFVTSEKAIERIKVYWPNGVFRGVVAGPDAFVEGTRGLDLAIDSKDRILVLDPEKKQIRIFALKTIK